MRLMYDHNQTFVADSFMALFIRNGRLTATRDEIERRYEFFEDLALHVASMSAMVAVVDKFEQMDALNRCRMGLLVAPSQVAEVEASWIVRRVAELLDWSWIEPGESWG